MAEPCAELNVAQRRCTATCRGSAVNHDVSVTSIHLRGILQGQGLALAADNKPYVNCTIL